MKEKESRSQAEIPEVLGALREVVAEAGSGYVYQFPEGGRCVYVANDQPDCIAARTLVRLGVPLELLASHEGGAVHLIRDLRQFVTVGALWVLRAAQVQQDAGAPWGVALAEAEESAKEALTCWPEAEK